MLRIYRLPYPGFGLIAGIIFKLNEMNYEENVRKVAEEMADDHYKEYHLGMETRKAFRIAKIAVRLQEEAARAAYEHCNSEPVFNPIGIESHLIQQGLIPAPELVSFYCGGDEIRKNDPCTDQCGICAKKQRDGHGTHH